MTASADLRALVQERHHHDLCRAALAAMIEGADEQVVIGENASASGADAEVLGYQLRSKAKELHELPEVPLFFGRLDFADGVGDHAGQSYHVGRRRVVEHPAAPPLVVDWRAPVSRAFYQAGPQEPQGVAVRRRFGWAPASKGDSADLTGLEDEWLTVEDGAVPAAAAASGEGSRIVAREIERPRVGPMRDIAATIQPDQDDLVRADLVTSVCVQGAPGTGKTAVGLHRAAYLLYTHPQRVQRGGLLILGPNRTFLTYISEVLPALGESGVRQSTIEEILVEESSTAVARARTYEDAEAAAAVKHDARMADVLHRALYSRVRPEAATDSLAIPDGSYRWRVPAGVLGRIVAGVREEEPPYAVGRERVRSRAVRHLQEQAERRSGPVNNLWLQKVGRSRPMSAYVDAVWPTVRPEEVVAGLLGDADALAAAADGILDTDEQRAILWAKLPRSVRSASWSAADLVLLDEVSGLLEHPAGYGHIVIDEAQDLSPMQARSIARRAAYGSLTVLGDLAQGTTPWAARTWGELLGHLGKPDALIAPLTTGFRVPGTVVALTNRLLGLLDVDVPPARSLRHDGEVRIRPARDVIAETVDAVREALAHEGSVGVVAADDETVRLLRTALADTGIEVGGPDDPRARVTVLGASVAKGLEYDHVVAVEPAAVAEAERRGLHRLYVVLTRAVSRLDVVHSRPLPFAAAS
ncbi:MULTISPECIES: AAA family ATPase [unclassified Streptomyces]|uniref:AAA family ATPase n=1 Tax=Streptomyces sp. NBC_00119 TaxID=2975659 RepID=A0AAU1U936_9ACTN|nr:MULTISPECIES: AAA family ATPase [unclassified Streptomyces]MCX4644630.1 AAA family ATPase [Streptomyces sp. NBC_01446]MCX5326715.1 AAA family ATPase [Streptomyces sp. NBC_00120]